MKLPAGSIKTWADLEKLFLAHFFEDDSEISVPTPCSQAEEWRVYQNFCREIPEHGTPLS